MGKFIDIKGCKFGEWIVLDYIGNSKWKCQCSCGKISEIKSADLRLGKTTNCGHLRIIDLTGKQINNWKVIEYSGDGKWKCQCSCGKIQDINGNSLRNNLTISCGHEKHIDLVGKQLGEWSILEYLGNSKFKCRCSCGNIRTVTSQSLRSGNSKSCGHINKDKKNIIGKKFGKLLVKEYINDGRYKCICDCGKEISVYRSNLISGHSRSCGHDKVDRLHKAIMISGETSSTRMRNPRKDWQIETLSSYEAFVKYITNLEYKPTINELSKLLDTDRNVILKHVHQLKVEDYVNILYEQSEYEIELLNYIKSIYDGKIIERDRNEIKPYELDIYIPEKRIAIEFNGNYWHSSLNKDVMYHQMKTLECAKKHIRLIHIFEYELINNKDSIFNLLRDTLCPSKVVFARQTKIRHVNASTAKEFMQYNHLDKFVAGKYYIGLYYNNELLSMIIIGNSRFNKEYEYELLRYATKYGYRVTGGLSKLLHEFFKLSCAKSLLTYVDISKFTGNGYLKTGFTLTDDCITKPNYVWVNKNNNVLTRYQTQKHKLVTSGIGNNNQTEDIIMSGLGYYKIYDSGNLRLRMIKQ